MSTAVVANPSLVAHVRRLSSSGSTLYIRIGTSDISRLELRHGQEIQIDLGRVRIEGIVKTSGGSPWLAPGLRGSNAAITAALRAAGLDHGMDVSATVCSLGKVPGLVVPAGNVRTPPFIVTSPKPLLADAPSGRRLRDQDLWEQITRRLTSFLPTWRDRISEFGQVSAVERRLNGDRWRDTQVFEGIVLGVLSNSIDWAKIQAVRPHLSGAFLGFSPIEYARLNERDVLRLAAWFNERGAVLPYHGKFLGTLRATADQLNRYSGKHGSLEHFLRVLYQANGNDAKRLAIALGSEKSANKLSALGVPLAAEALKNLGYDVAKPDRHINRAVGCFSLVSFPRWLDRSARTTPTLGPADPLSVMRAMETFSRAVGQRVTFVDNAIWLLCAKSGLWMTNSDLVALATE
jgi:3-methyladenine DNA glycosylase Tag